MSQVCRWGAKKIVLSAALLFALPLFSLTGAKAQRRVAEESELFKPSRPVQQQGQKLISNPTGQENKGKLTNIRKLVGSPAGERGLTTESITAPEGTLGVAAGPISDCVLSGGGPTITCDLYETDASGNPSKISAVVSLPAPQTGGYLVLKENAVAPDSDQSQWSDVLVFAPTAGNATEVQLFSAGCNTPNPNDRSCFPSFATVTADPDSGFIVENSGGVTVFNAGGSIYNIYSIDDNPPTHPFTLATSVGTVDEDSSALVQMRNFTSTFAPTATGSVHLRYNITAVDDIARFCPATLSVVRVRFRNNDNSGVQAQVSFEIHSTNLTSGGNNILYTFSSNGRGAGAAFTTATDSPAIDFDFTTNVYWIEATVFRSDPSRLADLGSIQIWEASGTPCP